MEALVLDTRGLLCVVTADVEDQISEVKTYIGTESSSASPNYNEPSDQSQGASCPPTDAGSANAHSRAELIRMLPNKPHVDRLVGSWYNSIDPLRIIVHAPSFQIDYRKFWQDAATADMQWLAMLFAIITLGAEISGQACNDATTLDLAEHLRKTTAYAIRLASCATLKRWLIETLLLHARAYMLREHDTSVHVCLLVGVCTHIAIMTGFHRDGSYNPAISPYLCEMRRRIWSCVREHDIGACYQRGAISAICRAKCDTQPPANLLDNDFSRQFVPPARSTEDYTPALYHRVYSELIHIFNDILHACEMAETSKGVNTSTLYHRLMDARTSWPKALRLTPFDEAFLDSTEVILNRFALEFLYARAVCVLYRDHLGSAGQGQERCLAAAEDLVPHQLSMLRHAQHGGRFASSRIFLKPHVHDFNLATMLLCLDETRSRSVGSEEDHSTCLTRLRPAIREACELWIQMGILSPKARHALSAVLAVVRRDHGYQTSSEAPPLTAEAMAEVGQAFDIDPPYSGIDAFPNSTPIPWLDHGPDLDESMVIGFACDDEDLSENGYDLFV